MSFHHEDSIDIENAIAGYTDATDEADIERDDDAQLTPVETPRLYEE